MHVPTKRPLPAFPLIETAPDSPRTFVSVSSSSSDEGDSCSVRVVTAAGSVITVSAVDFRGMDSALRNGDLAALKTLQERMELETTVMTEDEGFTCAVEMKENNVRGVGNNLCLC